MYNLTYLNNTDYISLKEVELHSVNGCFCIPFDISCHFSYSLKQKLSLNILYVLFQLSF
jgi:hypothetical protein